MRIVTAELLGDPSARSVREPTPEERRGRSVEGRKAPVVRRGTKHTAFSLRMKALTVGGKIERLTYKEQCAALNWARLNAIKIITRRQPDGTVTIWRVE